MALVKCKECGNDISTEAKTCPKCGAKNEKPANAGTALAFIVIAIIMLYGAFNMSSTTTQQSAPTPPDPKIQAISSLKVVQYEWHTSGSGSIMMLNITFKNEGPDDVKDITVVCKHSAKSGTNIDSNERTIYDIVKSKKTKKFVDFNMGFINSQVQNTRCYVKDLTVI